MKRLLLAAVMLLGLGAVASACDRCAPAAPTTHEARAAQTPGKDRPKVRENERMKKNREKAEEVWQKLLKADPDLEKNWPKNLTYPPVFEVVEHIVVRNSKGELVEDRRNAAASRSNLTDKDGKYVSRVEFTYGYLELLDGDEHGIALVLGHELGHHVLGHTTRSLADKPFLRAIVDGHRREVDADLFGAQLLLKAKYSLRQGVLAEWKGLDRHGLIDSSVDRICASHPATSDRAMRLFALLNDKDQEAFWRHMIDFENGTAFLAHGHYQAAEDCFNRVLKEFPNCFEAHANLGLCKLLRYITGLSADDLRDRDIGHFLVIAYPSARSAIPDRGGDSKLWFSAKDDLKKALDLKPDSALILSHLALAYLVHPDGKDTGTSLEYGSKAEKALDRTRDINGFEQFTLLVNLGVARLASREVAQAKRLFDRAERLVAGALGTDKKKWPALLRNPLDYNTALAQVGSDDNRAADLFKDFLTHAPRSSTWWPIAYERYEELCKQEGRTPMPKEQFTSPRTFQTQLLVTLPGNKVIHLGQSLPKALDILGTPDGVVDELSKTRRLKFSAHGIELLADSEEVFGITITSADGPVIEVREDNLTGHKLGELRVGMTRKEIETLLGGPGVNALDFFGKVMPYYPDLGVGVEYDKNGVAIRLVISPMATKRQRD